jgi:hypothetical protein
MEISYLNETECFTGFIVFFFSRSWINQSGKLVLNTVGILKPECIKNKVFSCKHFLWKVYPILRLGSYRKAIFPQGEIFVSLVIKSHHAGMFYE